MKKIITICLFFSFILAFSTSCATYSSDGAVNDAIPTPSESPAPGVVPTPPADISPSPQPTEPPQPEITPQPSPTPSLLPDEDGSSSRPATDIARIHVSHGAMQFNIGEYLIDFENKEFWKYEGDFFLGETNDLSRRDPEAENEGYEYGGKLSEEKIAAFLEQCDLYGFTAWEENYDDIWLADGHRWYVLITYGDGSEQVTRGSNDYPAAYDDMAGAFRDLTGEDVLLR